jgi:hypothetical protein
MQYFFSLIKEKCGFQICFYRKSGFFLALFIGKVYPAGFRAFQWAEGVPERRYHVPPYLLHHVHSDRDKRVWTYDMT